MLTPEAWKPVAAYIREQLGAAVATRAADEDVVPDVGSQWLSDALKMIAEGTMPEPGNFARFEPLAAADGRIGALRFVKKDLKTARIVINGAGAAGASIGRLLVRASGTEPLIRIMAEGDDEKLIFEIVHEIAGVVRQAAA